MDGFLKESLKMAINTMKSNKLRTILSILGVMIGVSALVTILSLGNSATKNMMSTFSEGGIDIITVRPKRTKSSREILTDDFSSELKNKIPSIENCIVANSQSCSIRNGSESISSQVIGTYSVMADFYSMKFDLGEWWTLDDNITSRQVCTIGYSVAEELFNGENPIGKIIKIFSRGSTKNFIVTGVISKMDSTASFDFDNCVFIPFNTFTLKIRKNSSVDNYIIRIKSGYDPSAEADNIEEYLSSLVSTDGFSLFSLSSLREMISKSMGTVTLFIAFISGISLIVGGVGIMNIMLVSVAERTKEIGILKAIGAQPKYIEIQFLIEAILLTLLGGIIGIIIGIILSLIISFALVWPPSISIASVFTGLLFSFFVGVFFGVYPARKASKLNPIEALSRQ